ncbi:MAG: MAPEG family protein, partial [Candidatus Binataceae bacterium]
ASRRRRARRCGDRGLPADSYLSSCQSSIEDIMAQSAIFGPFFATMLLTLLVWVYMYIRRISFITSGKITSTDLAAPGALARLSPPAVANPSDNLKNLFEIPVLFYALTLYLFVTHQVDAVYVYAAWIFVAFRVLHSAVHCTFNLIILRFYLYLAATIAVWFIAIRAGLSYFGA